MMMSDIEQILCFASETLPVFGMPGRAQSGRRRLKQETSSR
jgi:hypothetical protein